MFCFSSKRRGNKPVVGAALQPTFIVGQIYVKIGLSLSEYCRYHIESQLIFLIPILGSLLYLTLISIERFLAIKYTFRDMTIVAGPGCQFLSHCMFCNNSTKPFGWACNHFQGLCCFCCVSQLFVDTFVIYLFILPIVDTRNQSKVNKFLHEPQQTLQRRRKLWKLQG